MKGYVQTPAPVVDLMVEKLFRGKIPSKKETVLDPGCGDGAFINGILKYCKAHSFKPPQVIGIDSNPELLKTAHERFKEYPSVTLLNQDYLGNNIEPVDYIIGNPPYVPITELDEKEKEIYRLKFSTAIERFDLYILFFEQSVTNLKKGGRLCLITPEKFEFVSTASPLRRILGKNIIEEIHHIDEKTFPGLVTYPTITTLLKGTPQRTHLTTVLLRDGITKRVTLPSDGTSWNGIVHGSNQLVTSSVTLKDICIRISCGIATGADDIFVEKKEKLPSSLSHFAYPTISGRQLGPSNSTDYHVSDVMLIPYDKKGKLLPEEKIGDLRTYLIRPDNERKLKERTCITLGNRVWYQFHDNVPFHDILRPKIICKDITQEPHFWADLNGEIVPRHSVYYIVPKPNLNLNKLLDYLNSDMAISWIKANSQRAANNFYRVQSRVLKNLPIPVNLISLKTIDNY